jgi:uncharacterized membrane protein
MTKVERTLVINQPVERVFAYVTNPRNNPKWQPDILQSRVTPDEPTCVGTRVTDVRSLLGHKLELTTEVIEFEPNKMMRVKSASGPVPLSGCITFESIAGGTRIIFLAEAEPTGFFKLAERMFSSTWRKALEDSLNRLKELLEA